jgi:hypothetical protein
MNKKYIHYMLYGLFILAMPLSSMEQYSENLSSLSDIRLEGQQAEAQEEINRLDQESDASNPSNAARLLQHTVDAVTYHKECLMRAQESVQGLRKKVGNYAKRMPKTCCSGDDCPLSLEALQYDVILFVQNPLDSINQFADQELPSLIESLQQCREFATKQTSIDEINQFLRDAENLKIEMLYIQIIAEKTLDAACALIEDFEHIQVAERIPLAQLLTNENRFKIQLPIKQSQTIVLASPVTPLAHSQRLFAEQLPIVDQENFPVTPADSQNIDPDDLFAQGPPKRTLPIPLEEPVFQAAAPVAQPAGSQAMPEAVDTAQQVHIHPGLLADIISQESLVQEPLVAVQPAAIGIDAQQSKEPANTLLRQNKQSVALQYNKVLKYGGVALGVTVIAASAVLLYHFYRSRVVVETVLPVEPIRCMFFSLISKWGSKKVARRCA